MNIIDMLPWEEIALHLRERVDATSGPVGAAIGAGLGAASAVARMKNEARPFSIQPLIVSTIAGTAYGFLDSRTQR